MTPKPTALLELVLSLLFLRWIWFPCSESSGGPLTVLWACTSCPEFLAPAWLPMSHHFMPPLSLAAPFFDPPIPPDVKPEPSTLQPLLCLNPKTAGHPDTLW